MGWDGVAGQEIYDSDMMDVVWWDLSSGFSICSKSQVPRQSSRVEKSSKWINCVPDNPRVLTGILLCAEICSGWSPSQLPVQSSSPPFLTIRTGLRNLGASDSSVQGIKENINLHRRWKLGTFLPPPPPHTHTHFFCRTTSFKKTWTLP